MSHPPHHQLRHQLHVWNQSPSLRLNQLAAIHTNAACLCHPLNQSMGGVQLTTMTVTTTVKMRATRTPNHRQQNLNANWQSQRRIWRRKRKPPTVSIWNVCHVCRFFPSSFSRCQLMMFFLKHWSWWMSKERPHPCCWCYDSPKTYDPHWWLMSIAMLTHVGPMHIQSAILTLILTSHVDLMLTSCINAALTAVLTSHVDHSVD